MKSLRSCLAGAFFILLTATACSQEEPTQPPETATVGEETTVQSEGTIALETTPETTSEGLAGEGTLGPTSGEEPELTLRLEGDGGTLFSGICNVGGEESVLSGEVPRRFTFADLGGSELSCRIQKQDESAGSLRVILLSGNTTRSVQQTNSPGGTIEVSFSG